MRSIILAAVLAIPQANCPTKPKPNYKVTKVSIQDVAISCVNGQPPEVSTLKAGTKVTTVIISCDGE